MEHERVYGLQVAAKALTQPVSSFGWLMLAMTGSEQTCDDAEIVRAYRDQTTSVELGFRWIKNPAAISPVWLEKREHIAALVMLTAYSTEFCHLIHRKAATQSTRILPPNPWQSCHPVHANPAA